jgi:hypothetical protein
LPARKNNGLRRVTLGMSGAKSDSSMATARSPRKARADLSSFESDRDVLERLADAIREVPRGCGIRSWLVVGHAYRGGRDTQQLPRDRFGFG